jgi:DNA-binding MarR family transcriptional regulator
MARTRHTPGAEEIVERAMVALRRRQSRRALAHRAEQQHGSRAQVALTEVLDAVQANADAGRATTVNDISAQLHVDQPRASRLVARAVEGGLLRRFADQHDGRRSLLQLTAKGRAHLDRVRRFRREQFALAMKDWSEEDRRTFAELLARFVDAVDKGDRE